MPEYLAIYKGVRMLPCPTARRIIQIPQTFVTYTVDERYKFTAENQEKAKEGAEMYRKFISNPRIGAKFTLEGLFESKMINLS